MYLGIFYVSSYVICILVYYMCLVMLDVSRLYYVSSYVMYISRYEG